MIILKTRICDKRDDVDIRSLVIAELRANKKVVGPSEQSLNQLIDHLHDINSIIQGDIADYEAVVFELSQMEEMQERRRKKALKLGAPTP